MRQHLADYYACVSDLDDQVGRILESLRELGYSENTVVIFSSDQGLAVGGRHGLMGKQNLYEHVKPPLVISGPGIPHGQSDALVYLYDLFPTICDYAQAPIPSVVEGKSLAPIVRGEATDVRPYLVRRVSRLATHGPRQTLEVDRIRGWRPASHAAVRLIRGPRRIENLADRASNVGSVGSTYATSFFAKLGILAIPTAQSFATHSRRTNEHGSGTASSSCTCLAKRRYGWRQRPGNFFHAIAEPGPVIVDRSSFPSRRA